ncbi:MAG: hypothetical protein JGK24_05010 [Microcoleus sp. PH2017_29_MFU_D_A]|uniref:hypothetical protein n=1 Tax=unclassified Microcoleus TaxID=2642155 RepID=UPI001DE99275|nr:MULTISPECIES: hypothetical protein [unclassified Microcoleus]MCC3432285.1 hypothetical protein [Microcoleus sp. PH2017_04_SCI_O_A]MCC3502490.1 hypothetical protein [Microcoleus sp. PH2017_19_SFW_U_A]MCC3548590.1 hypothetical protein [Microcoleus sp. PH2017_24_DOB_U_A]MCC3591582.1 hypothetical protein [Microcoleus sp. PH2017_28_MFU_U_A]TAE14513.1 MAG: hypothetical protein EAZ94_07025 [Oscillatoriales cyanobacterium]
MTPLDESGMWIFGLKFGDQRDLSTWDGIRFWVRSRQHARYPDRYYLIRSRGFHGETRSKSGCSGIDL